jgi:hypothetical protein
LKTLVSKNKKKEDDVKNNNGGSGKKRKVTAFMTDTGRNPPPLSDHENYDANDADQDGDGSGSQFGRAAHKKSSKKALSIDRRTGTVFWRDTIAK